MTDTKQPREAWSEVGRQFEELGRTLRGHFEREGERDADAGAPGPEAGGPSAEQPGGDRAAMRNALRRLGQAAQQLGEQANEAVRDQAVRESAQRAGHSLVDALDATFTELGEDLRGRMRARRGGEPDGGAGTSESTPPKEIDRPE